MTTARGLFGVWLALLGLLALTAGSSLVSLGWGNTAVNLAIASLKALLILLFFMKLRSEDPLIRLAATAVGLWLAILFGLTVIDYVSR